MKRDRKSTRRRRPGHVSVRSILALVIAATCFATLTALCVFFGVCYLRSSITMPSPTMGAAYESDGFPKVDWDYWLHVNPDVVGWISVPDTPVSYPIVQAPEQDPDFYLTHDVYKSWNFAGCPYLDACCREGGLLGSRNAIVFGHNLGLGDTSLFATFSKYTQASFAERHRVVLLQTPQAKRVYLVQGAACIPGSQTSKRVDFADDRDFLTWYVQRLEDCSYVAAHAPGSTRNVLTLCTCSYSRWDDERTLVYAAPTMSP